MENKGQHRVSGLYQPFSENGQKHQKPGGNIEKMLAVFGGVCGESILNSAGRDPGKEAAGKVVVGDYDLTK